MKQSIIPAPKSATPSDLSQHTRRQSLPHVANRTYRQPLRSILGRAWAGTIVGLVLLTCVPTAPAIPYASCVTNRAGTVSFILNESAAEVKVVLSGGTGGTTNLGACAKGPHSFDLGANTAFSIQVSNNAPFGWAVSSDDFNPLVRFYSPRGVAVSCSPTNLATFGRIYVANATVGTTTAAPTNNSRFTGRGMYILNADQTDAFGEGTNARTAGITFDTKGHAYAAAVSPWRIELGPDGCLYVCDYSVNTGTLYRTDPDVTTNVMVLQGQGRFGNLPVHTTIAGVYVEGSLERGDLTVYAADGGWANPELTPNATEPYQGVLRWQIGAGPLPWNGPPEQLRWPIIGYPANLNYDLDRGPEGKFYYSCYRDDWGNLTIFDIHSSEEWSFGDPDFWHPTGRRGTRGLKVAGDGSCVAWIQPDNQVRLSALTNGIPDHSHTLLIDAFGNPRPPGIDVAFDAAGNLYAVSAGAEMLRILSPGGQTVATTGFDGTNGSFMLTRQVSDVRLTLGTSTNDCVQEGWPDSAPFIITRSGSTAQPLTVYYRMSGPAANGVDYTNLAGSLVISAGAAAVKVWVSPIDDSVSEETETVILTLTGSGEGPYGLGAPSACIRIYDNDRPQLAMTGLHTNLYESDPVDFATVRVTQTGDLSWPGYYGLNWLGGSAVWGEDYEPLLTTGPDPLTGVVEVARPLNDHAFEGPESFSARLLPDQWGVTMVGTNIVTCTIRDDERNGPRLFAENFENPAAVTNWGLSFAARNGIRDCSADFGRVYWTSADTNPPAPHSIETAGSNRCLFLTVNKEDTSALGGAGVNVYPIAQVFSNDFALRFDLFLVGGSGLPFAPTTEHAIFGINHSGSKTNWFRCSGDGAPGGDYDGLWFQIAADGAGYGDYVVNTGPAVTQEGVTSPTVLASRTAASLRGAFPAGNHSPLNGVRVNQWVDVEVRQLGTLVTLRINGVDILSVTNTTPYTNGTIMLGYDDAYDSIGSYGYVLYDNVEVYRLVPVVVAAGSALVAESCPPANQAIDPGEMVTISLALKNVGSRNTTNLIATLQPSGGVTAPSASQNYGVLETEGAAISRPFSFTANGACGGRISATLQLREGSEDLDPVSFELQLGKATLTTSSAEYFDQVTAPALPSGWTSSIIGPGTPWATWDLDVDTPSNAAFCEVPYGENLDATDGWLASPHIAIGSPDAQLVFRHKWLLVSGAGGVLEISINGGPFTDILSAGGSFAANGYVDRIEDEYGFGNPLAGRWGWTGMAYWDFFTTVVNLPTAAGNSIVQLRWRLGTEGHSSGGFTWVVDTISLVNASFGGAYSCCAAPVRPTIANPCVQGNLLLFSVQSLTGQTYQVEYKNDLKETNWTLLQSIPGDGSLLRITNTLTSPTQGFFRLRSP